MTTTTTDPTTPAPEMTAPTMLLLDKHKLQVAIGEFVYQRFQCGQERALAEAEGFMRHIPDSAYVANEYAAAERPAEGTVVICESDLKAALTSVDYHASAMMSAAQKWNRKRPPNRNLAEGCGKRSRELRELGNRIETALAASSAEPDAAPEQGEETE